MSKACLLALVFFSAPALAIPPVDRYGGRYEVQPDTTTGVHYKFYLEPNINDFEYRAMMEDLFTIAKSSITLSECSRWKIINTLLETRVDPYITYPEGVFRSTTPWNPLSVVYFTTQEAVWRGKISSSTANYDLHYSTIQICKEGEDLDL